MIWIFFGIGLFAGTLIGILIAALCVVAGKNEPFEKEIEKDENKRP